MVVWEDFVSKISFCVNIHLVIWYDSVTLSESEPYYCIISDLKSDKFSLFWQFYFLSASDVTQAFGFSTWDVTQAFGVLILY
jgi:hypothetical protein